MKVTRYDGSQEQRIATAMIVNRAVAANLASRWIPEGLFSSKWFNILGKASAEHFKRFDKAFGKDVEIWFRSWAEKQKDEDTIRILERILSNLSDQYETQEREVNPQVILDLAGELVHRVQLSRTADAMQAAIDIGDLEEAEKARREHRKIELGSGDMVDVFEDAESTRESLEEPADPIIRYRGALGKFLGDALNRDCFITLLAPEKRGKTTFLIDFAFQALQCRRRVVFFEIGDLSKNQITRRFAIRASGRPRRACVLKFPKSIKIEGDSYKLTTKEKEYNDPVDWRSALVGFDKMKREKIKSLDTYFKLCCVPAGTITVAKMQSRLEQLQLSGWGTDVVIVDYADLIQAPPGIRDTREKFNEIWTQLRALSSTLHCLLITATQSNRASYKAKVITMEHSSEDKRKQGHVAGMISLNQTTEEKRDGVMRLVWAALREEDYNDKRPCYVAGLPALMRPMICSDYR